MNGGYVSGDSKYTISGDGGFLVPKVAYVDKPSKGLLALFLRWFGQRIIFLGAWIRSLGYYQEEIHSYDEIIKSIMHETRVLRK